MERKKTQLFVLVLIGVVIAGLCWIGLEGNKNRKERIGLVEKGYRRTNALLTRLKSYKGHFLTVSFSVDGKKYEVDGPWYENSDGVKVGDSIEIKYALDDPSIIINELEKEY